mgnify:FL=1
MRLDVYLAENKIIKSRELAKKMISEGGVTVNGEVVTKPAKEISEGDEVKVTAELPAYVGRGGLKLEKALDSFHIDVSGLVCMDIGASTGGFTDCLLQRGAAYVYAVDVGHGQLDPKLAADERVANLEGMNIRNVSADEFDKPISFICTDVSFISLTKVIPKIYELLESGGKAAMLIKPQFECGRSDIGKNGIVKSEKAQLRAVKEIYTFCGSVGMGVKGLEYSPIKGGDGNIEFLILAVKDVQSDVIDCARVVSEARKAKA